MPIVTFTTDWGIDGTYSGAVKGRILSSFPSVQLVDISHQIKSYDIGHAAFVIRNIYSQFPDSTIHVIGVGGNIPNRDSSSKFVVIEYRNHYFVGNDDGIWGLIFDEPPVNVFSVGTTDEMITEYGAFVELCVFTNIVNGLLSNKSLGEIGFPHDGLKRLMPGMATLSSSMINGSVIYIDAYGNAITNISRFDFNRVCKGREYEILAGSYKYSVDKINKTYQESEKGELLAIFSYSGLLEIAIANGSASSLLGLNRESQIRIKFYDNKHSKNEGQALLFG